jgi:hypothetical protein
VANIGKEDAFVDGDVGGVLVGGAEEESVELSSESHSRHMCASPPFFL